MEDISYEMMVMAYNARQAETNFGTGGVSPESIDKFVSDLRSLSAGDQAAAMEVLAFHYLLHNVEPAGEKIDPLTMEPPTDQ